MIIDVLVCQPDGSQHMETQEVPDSFYEDMSREEGAELGAQ